MQRLDHEYMMRTSEAPLLKKLPSEYMRDMFYTTQPMERSNEALLAATMDAVKADTQMLYASGLAALGFRFAVGDLGLAVPR